MRPLNYQHYNDNIIPETNDLFQSIKKYIQEYTSKSQFIQNTNGFLSIVHYISIFMKNNMINYKDLRSIGIILFNDRMLIEDTVFSIAVNWDAKDLFNVISSPEFFCQFLTRSQFMTLVKAKYIEGCIFDWHVLRYPECDLTQKIINNIIPIGGESFFLVFNDVQSMINYSKSKLQLSKFDIIDTPPDKNNLVDNQDSSLEDFFLSYVDGNISGKCWLLYKNDKEK